MSMRRVSLVWAAMSLGYMGVLLFLSSLPGSATGPDTPLWRFLSNALHVPFFAGLAVCLALTFRTWPIAGRAACVSSVGAAYAVFDEWHQSWVPDRSMSLTDVGLDLTGVLLVILILLSLGVSREGADRRLAP